MTIPSRPAPAPPGSSAQSAVAGANASLDQLRLQLQQQQQFQQQNGGIQRITIKLPPPPKGPLQNGTASQQQQQLSSSSSNSSITRKFPQARYSPATNWDDSPFDGFTNGATTTKKVPPPRPPPPKVTATGRKATTAPPPPPKTRPQQNTSSKIITNIFQRKHKQAKAPAPNNSNNSAARVYGLSSGISGSTNSINSTSLYKTTTTTSTSNYSTYSILTRNTNGTTANNANVDWNAAWNTTATTTTNMQSRSATPSQTTTLTTTNGEPQLISFDSPPSSPTFTQKSNSDCVSVDSFSSDSNFSSPNNGSVSQPESGFEDDFSGNGQHLRSRPTTASPLDPWETLDAFDSYNKTSSQTAPIIGTAPVRNIPAYALRTQQTNNATTDNPLCNGKSLLPPAPSLTMPTIIKPKISQKPKAPKPPVLHSKTNFNGNLYGSTSPTPLTPPSPPMPICAPPPPPPSNAGISILDVISGKVDALQLTSGSTGFIEEIEQPFGIALYDFDGVEEGDLSFRENEKIYLIEQASAEWYRGRTRSGCEGIFPVNYIEIKVPLSATNAISSSATTTTSTQKTYYQQQQQQSALSPSPSSSSRATLPTVRCLYDFPADVAGDLPLKENDFVTILYRINEDWLFGEMHGRQGQFPANFLEYLPDNIPYVP